MQLTELAMCMCGVARGMSEWCTLISSPFPLCCVQTPSKKKVEISTIASNYHIEMNPRSVVTVGKAPCLDYVCVCVIVCTALAAVVMLGFMTESSFRSC